MAKRSTMRKFLRKPKKPEAKVARRHWQTLYTETLRRARIAKDPRVRDLEHFASDPELALRKLSILTEVDLNREFPREP